MFTHKIQTYIAFSILAMAIYCPAASVYSQESDSICILPEITVTASRYAYMDGTWLVMLDTVLVEAQRPLSDRYGTVAGEEFDEMIGTGVLSKDMESRSKHYRDRLYLLTLSAFTLMTLSFIYMSFRVHRLAKEVKHVRTEH